MVTTLPEKPVPFRLDDTEIVSLLFTNTSFGIPVNIILATDVLAGYTSSSSPFKYEVKGVAALEEFR